MAVVSVCVCVTSMLTVRQNILQEDEPTVADSTGVRQHVCDSDTLGCDKNRNTVCACFCQKVSSIFL